MIFSHPIVPFFAQLEDPISDLLVGLAHLQDARQRVHQLQILLFLVSKNWNNLHSELNRKVLQSLQNLLTEDDLDSRSWAFCCLAAAAAAQASSHEAPVQASTSKTALLQKETDSSWEFIWSSALRNLTNRNVCRAAAHAVSALLQPHLEQSMPSKPSPHPLVPLHIVRSSTFSLIQDLAVQGPGFPSDSVCETLTAFLRIARADAELFQASFPTKILAWLTSVWKPDARRSRCVKGEWEDPVSLIRLMLHLIGVDDIARKVPRLEVVPPRCDIVQVAIDDATCVRVRHFLYETQIDDSSSPNDTNSSQSKLPTISGAGELSISTAVLTFCQEALEAYLPEDDTQPSSQSHNFESLQRALKLLSVSLFVFGAVRSKRPQSQRTLTRHASRLLRHLIPSVVSSRWNSSEKASLVAILGIFLCPATASPFQNVLRGLTHPGPVSNVPMHLYHSPEAPCLDACMSDIISQIWSSDDLAPLLSEGGPINTVCRHMALNTSLSFVEGADVEPYNDGTPKSSLITQKGLSQFTTQIASSQIKLDQDSDDGFGSVRDAAPAGIKRKTGGGPRHGANPASSNSVLSAQDHCTEVITLTALKGLLAPLHANVATTPAVGLSAQPIISLLAESEGESFLAILNALLSLISSGLVCLSLSEADQLFEKIGTSFLPAYEHARDPRTYLLTVRLLSVSAALWVPASEEDQSGAFTSNARKLCTWLSDVQSQARLAAWRVRLELVAFLDHFTQLNPQENIWGDEDLAEDDNGAHLVPTQLVPQMIQDVDFRVR